MQLLFAQVIVEPRWIPQYRALLLYTVRSTEVMH
jgi:hypothetical protein